MAHGRVLKRTGDLSNIVTDTVTGRSSIAIDQAGSNSLWLQLPYPVTTITLTGQREFWKFAKDGAVWIAYKDKLGEVRQLNVPDKPIPLSGKVNNLYFNADGKWVLIRYADADKGWELRQLSAPDKPIPLSGKVQDWAFSTDGKWVWIRYADADKGWELRQLSAPDKPISLSGEVFVMEFSADGKWVQINYADADKGGELRQLSAPDSGPLISYRTPPHKQLPRNIHAP